MAEDILMCKETERLVRLLGSSDSPTDMALIILANKIDKLDERMDSLGKATEFARWIDTHKKTIMGILSGLIIFSVFGIRVFMEFVKKKLGL